MVPTVKTASNHPRVEASEGRYVAARVSDFAGRDRLFVTVAGRAIGIFYVEGKYYALANRCPHQGADLCRGQLMRPVEATRPGEYRYVDAAYYVVCPWHGWEFDLATGQSYFDPERTRVKTYPVEVIDRASDGTDHPATKRVPGPYSVETFPVEVEDGYLVVSLHRPRRIGSARAKT
jgi:nitrite reductase/ring-hydroxylating ferredoxin subunit